MKKNSLKYQYPKRSYILRAAVGIYLLYLTYKMFQDLGTVTGSKTIAYIGMVAFLIIGIILCINGASGLLYKSKHPDTPPEESEPLEESEESKLLEESDEAETDEDERKEEVSSDNKSIKADQELK